MKCILVLESLFIGLEKIVEAAQKRSIQIILLTSNPSQYFYSLSKISSDFLSIELVNTKNVALIKNKIEEISQKYIILGLINPTDTFAEIGLQIANLFNFKITNPNAVINVRNKHRLRELLRHVNLDSTKSTFIDNLDNINKLSQDIYFPVIIKDDKGTGSRKIYVANNNKDIDGILPLLKSEKTNFIIEEYILGPLYSAELICYQNNCQILGYNSRILSDEPNFMEFGTSFPINFPKSLDSQIAEYINKVMGALNYGNGFAHVEFILSKKGPIIVEINPRLGGGAIGLCICKVYNYNIYNFLIDLALDIPPNLPRKKLAIGMAQILIYAKTNGIYVGINGIEKSLGCPGNIQIIPIVQEGHQIEYVNDQRGCVAILIAEGDNSEIAMHYAQAAANKLQVVVNEN